MKKILIFGMSSTVGGVENFILNLYEKINKNKIQMDFLVTNGLEGVYRDKLIGEYKATVHIIPSITNNLKKCKQMIKEIALTNNYDEVHINLCSSQLFIYIWLLKKYSKNNLKIITHSHSSGESSKIRKILHYFFKPMLIKNTNVYIACSKVAGEWMFGKKIANSKKFITIKNAINVEKFSFDDKKRNLFRKENSYNEKDFVIGHVGRFEEVKNHRFIIEMFKQYHDLNKNAKLLLVGDGSLKEEIKESVNNLKLKDCVKILNVSQDVDKIYQGMDLFILPSLFEGLPTVGIEAQTSGLKCIFSNNITVEADITGNVQFLPLEIDLWIKAINEIRIKEHKRDNVRKQIATAGYDLDEEILKIERIYEDNL